MKLIGQDHYQDWLNLSREVDEAIFASNPSEKMHDWPVGASVANFCNQGARLVDEVEALIRSINVLSRG